MENRSIKQIKIWSDEETTVLFDKYAELLEQTGPHKQYRNKKQMWRKIASYFDKTPDQCESRVKTVMRRKRAAVYNSATSNAKRQRFGTKHEFKKSYSSDESIESQDPLSLQICKIQQIRKANRPNSPIRSNFGNKEPTLIELALQKEENKERRHREKLEAANRVCDLLEKLVDKIPPYMHIDSMI